MIRYDKPNTLYKIIGQTVANLAMMGATDEELERLFDKGGDATIQDVAEIEYAHSHEEERDD